MKTRHWTTWTAATVFAALLFGSAPATADFDQAVALMKQKKWVESAEQWENVLTNAPEYDWGHYAIGVCYFMLDKHRDAELRFKTAIELNPSDVNYHMNLAKTQLKLQKFNDVVVTLDKSETLVDDVNRTGFHRTRGLALSRVKDYDRAIDDLRKANPVADQYVALELGRSCFAIGDTPCVAKAIGQSLAKKAKDPVALEILAKAQLEAARRAGSGGAKSSAYGKAADAARKLVAAKPNDVDGHELLGASLLGSDDLDGAVAEYRKVLSLQPKNCTAMLNISQAKAKQKRFDEILDFSTQAAKCDPKNHLAFTQIAFAHNGKRDWDAAEEAAKKAISLKETAFAKQQLQLAQDGRSAEETNRQSDEEEAAYQAELQQAEAAERERLRRIKEYETKTGAEVEDDGK